MKKLLLVVLSPAVGLHARGGNAEQEREQKHERFDE